MAYISYPYNYMSNFRCHDVGAHDVGARHNFRDNMDNMSACVPQETYIKNVRLAAAYVPCQKFCTMFSPIEALMKGTAFPELFSPYEGKCKKCTPLDGIKREDEL